MANTDATVLLVDDDAEVRDAIGHLLRSAGWKSRTFASAQEFVDTLPFTGVGCVLLDISMPGMTGPELHDWMRAHDCILPVVYLSGRCDVPISVTAMKCGAVDVLQKPADDEVLLQSIANAVERHRLQLAQRESHDDIEHRLALLTPRERQVLDLVSQGRLNKQIAADLGIALKTVKVHRGRAMAKMGVRTVAALVHLRDWLAAPAP